MCEFTLKERNKNAGLTELWGLVPVSLVIKKDNYMCVLKLTGLSDV